MHVQFPNWLRPFVAVVVLVGLLWLYAETANRDGIWFELLAGLSVNLIAVAVVFVAVWLLFDRYDGGLVGELASRLRDLLRPGTAAVQAVYGAFPSQPLSDDLSRANRLAIVCRWTQIDGTELRDFFAPSGRRKAGRVHMFIVDPDEDSATDLADAQRAGTDSCRNRAIATVKQFEAARVATPGAAKTCVKVTLLPFAPNYTAYCFDERVLYLGPYEHSFQMDARAPRQRILLSDDARYAAFWECELNGFVKFDTRNAVDLIDERGW